MPIFSNRTIALMIRSLPGEARQAYTADLLGRMDQGGVAAVAAEWELLILHQLAKTGQLELVLPTHGKSRPDAIFLARSTGERAVVEVTAISDEEIHSSYPASELQGRFHSGLRKLSDKHLGAFDVDCRGPTSADGRPTLALPAQREMDRFFTRSDVRQYLHAITAEPDAQRTFVYTLGEAATTVTYRPGADISYLSGDAYRARMFNRFTEARLLRRVAKKATQINASGLNLPSILVLCDNDCHILRNHKPPPWSHAGTLDSISTHIQGQPTTQLGGPWIRRGKSQQTTAINAVFTLWVDEYLNNLNQPARCLGGAFVPNTRKAKYALSQAALATFSAALADTPRFIDSPVNARQPRRWPHHFGGGTVSITRLRFSMLAIQDLLTGKLPHSEFAQHHKFAVEHLQRLSATGKCLSSASVISSPDTDDDWIEFEFSNADPRRLRPLVDSD